MKEAIEKIFEALISLKSNERNCVGRFYGDDCKHCYYCNLSVFCERMSELEQIIEKLNNRGAK